MTIKLTERLIDNLQQLIDMKRVSYSAFPQSVRDILLEDGLVVVENRGTRRYVRVISVEALKGALPRYNEALRDLEAARALLAHDTSRAAQASLSGNSKTRGQRSCPGFLVNAYDRLDCMLGGRPFAIDPSQGSAVYIADWESLTPPPSVLVVGIENMENFIKIREQRAFFAEYMNRGETGILFVSRYAFSNDLAQWLSRLPNRYLHFGDFDLYGIKIFLTQFKPYVGEKGSFLIPSDIESRLSHGSRQRYDDQYRNCETLSTDDEELNGLIRLIHKYRRAYDQEGYIVG